MVADTVEIKLVEYEQLCRLVSAVESLVEGNKRSGKGKSCKDMPDFPKEGLVTPRQAMAFMGVKSTKFYDMANMEGFPKRVNLHNFRDPRWWAQEIREYCEKGYVENEVSY